MRPLTDEETKVFFTKLAKYIGQNIKFLIERSDEPYVFRLIKDRVYYMSEKLMLMATNIGRDELIHVGVCFGKFSKTGRFRLNITALDFIAKYAKHKIWLKSSGEQSYVYGNHVIKSHIARMTENIPKYDGIVVYSINDTPLGFGIAGKSTLECKSLEPTAIVVFNQSDVGEYLRVEDE